MNNETAHNQEQRRQGRSPSAGNKNSNTRFNPRHKASNQRQGGYRNISKPKFTKQPVDPKAAKNKAKTLESFKQCRKHWPHIFNLLKVKPVSVGMRQELLSDAKERGIEVTNSTVYNALFWLTSTVQYKEALVAQTNRYNSKGEAVGVVSEEEKARAKEALDTINGRTKKIASIVVAKGLKKQNQNRNSRTQRTYNGNRSQNGNRHPYNGNRAENGNRQQRAIHPSDASGNNGHNRPVGGRHQRQQRSAKISYRSTQPRSFSSSAPTSVPTPAAKAASDSE